MATTASCCLSAIEIILVKPALGAAEFSEGADTPSPRVPPAKRPARRGRAPAKIAGSPDDEHEGDSEHEKPAKHAAGLLGMFERQESDDDLSEDGMEAEATHAPSHKPKRGGGRWGELHSC